MKYIMILILLLTISCGEESKETEKIILSDPDTSSLVLAWPESEFPLRLIVPSSLEASFSTAYNNAANKWNDALGFTAFEIVFEGNNIIFGTSSQYLNDDIFSVAFPPDWIDVETSVLALTSFSFFNGTLLHADIIFNILTFTLDTSPNNSEIDFETVLIHEMGHFLGLKHVASDIDSLSVMQPSLRFGQRRRNLSAGDIQRIQELY